MTLLLGLDIGTSSAKAIVLESDNGQIIASAGQEYAIQKPAPDRAEQDPQVWWDAIVNVARRVTAQQRDISAIGLTGQMHGTVLLDKSGNAMCPAIIWADQRSAQECEDLIHNVGDEALATTTGTLPAAGFMVVTLMWLARHQPELLKTVYRVVLPKDTILQRLTGSISTEVSDAAATGLFDITRREWSSLVLDAIGVSPDVMPPVLDSSAIAGTLSADAAQALGLRAGIPVAAGCADQPAQALANGIIMPGKMSITTGTGGQVFAPLKMASGQVVPTDSRLHVFNHAVPDTYYVLAAILSAGLSLRWLRNLLGLQGHPDAYKILSHEAALVPIGADGLIFLPYLLGERTPHMNPHVRGGFLGLSYHHQRGHLARAVMEGVACALRQALKISQQLSGDVQQVIVSGGGVESDVWRQIQADVFGLPLQKTTVPEQTCVGAALLAGIGTGVFASFEEASASVARYGDITEPLHHEQYGRVYQRFVSAYPRINHLDD